MFGTGGQRVNELQYLLYKPRDQRVLFNLKSSQIYQFALSALFEYLCGAVGLRTV